MPPDKLYDMFRGQVLAARDGIVAAFCDHFSEGGLRESLLPRANFVALRHLDSTYTRYVHLMHGGVLVRLGQASANKGVGERGRTRLLLVFVI